MKNGSMEMKKWKYGNEEWKYGNEEMEVWK